MSPNSVDVGLGAREVRRRCARIEGLAEGRSAGVTRKIAGKEKEPGADGDPGRMLEYYNKETRYSCKRREIVD